jgi:phage-related holin
MHSVLAWSKALLITVVAFFTPIHKLLLLTTVLIGLDLVTGLVAAWKRGTRITSARLSGSIVKVAVYTIAMCACHIVEVHFVAELPIVRLLASLVGLRELMSILENLNIASGRDLLSDLMAQLKSNNVKPPIDPK